MDFEDIAVCLTLSFVACFILFVISQTLFSRLYVSWLDIDMNLKFLMKGREEAFPWMKMIGLGLVSVVSFLLTSYSAKYQMMEVFICSLSCGVFSVISLVSETGTWWRKHIEAVSILLAEIRSDGPDQSKENCRWRYEFEQWLLLLHVIDEEKPGLEGVLIDESICGPSKPLTSYNRRKLKTMLYHITSIDNGRIKISRSAADPL